jgi:hypothetical protein
MGLERQHDIVLWPELGRIVRAARTRDELLVVGDDPHALIAHRRQVGAARHQADIGAGAAESRAEIAADRTRSHHADFHGPAPCR